MNSVHPAHPVVCSNGKGGVALSDLRSFFASAPEAAGGARTAVDGSARDGYFTWATALAASEERYRLLFEAMPLPVIVWDKATLRLVAVNDACVRKYGWSRAQLLEMTVFDIRPPSEVERFKAYIADLQNENFVAGLWPHWNEQGETFLAEITTHGVEFGGRPARLSVINDVTERQRLEERLRQSQKMEATGLLAGGVAHDFNNLLGVVIGASALARRASGNSSAGRYIDEIEAAAKRAADLTRKLLAFSRKQVLQVRPIELGEAIDEFLQLLRRVIGEDIELVVRPSCEPLVVEADASQLEQVLLNLCTNARQAMPSGGSITLELRRAHVDDFRALHDPWPAAGDYAELLVVDTGVGMDEETRSRMFEPFFTKKTEGTGLGLAMVHGIVQQHRGFVDVESRVGHGTTMHVLLPLADVPETHERNVPSGAPGPGCGETILVAEDEPALRRMLASTLTDLGYEVIVAPDGEEAVRAFDAWPGRIAMVILDVVMPRLGGVPAFQRMRALQPDLKVIFTTGYASDCVQVRELVEIGSPPLLSKPFSPRELARRVREALDATALLFR